MKIKSIILITLTSLTIATKMYDSADNIKGHPYTATAFQMLLNKYKKDLLLNDNKTSFYDFETNLKKRYPQVKIPYIDIEKDPIIIGYNTKGMNYDYDMQTLPNILKQYQLTLNLDQPKEKVSRITTPSSILIHPAIISQLSPEQLEFFMLHEAGHADSDKAQFANYAKNIASLGTLFAWGRHKTKPYKNIVTKGLSKVAAATTLPALAYVAWLRFYEEPYADSFACKHASKDTLTHMAKTFDTAADKITKQFMLQQYPETKTRENIPNWFINLLSIDHPSVSSRVAKIERTIQERFPNEA